MSLVNRDHRPRLIVCTTCQRPEDDAKSHEPDTTSGAQLYKALCAADDEGVTIVEAKCLAMCATGCAAVLSMPGKWGWLLHKLHPQFAHDILFYVAQYVRSESGVIMPSKRPESLRNVLVGRFPA